MKQLSQYAYRSSSWPLRNRFRSELKEHPEYKHLNAEDVWEQARNGDVDALQIRAALLPPRDEEFLRGMRPSDERTLRQGGRPSASKRRGAAIAKGQITKRWATHIEGLAACAFCGLVVHRRQYHPDCWDTWRRTPAWQAERERRRWANEKHARRPIEPPKPRGRPSRRLNQKYGWLMLKLSGISQKEMATNAGVSKAAVNIGIGDFIRWLPAGWDLVFPGKAARAANLVREQLFPLSDRRTPGREPLVARLGRWGMEAKKISRVIGYPVEQVLRALNEKSPTRRVGQHRRRARHRRQQQHKDQRHHRES